MDLRHLRYFVAIAEARHFTRAAEQLGISQPPLSMQMRQFEEEIGHALFYRLRSGIELTDAGRALLPHARALLAAAAESVQVARRAARGETGELRLGLSGSTPFHPAVPDLIRRFRSAYPDVVVLVRETQSAALLDDLLHHRLDIALVLEPFEAGPELKSLELLSMPVAAALMRSHPLADRETIALRELALEPFVLLPRALGPGWHDLVTTACREAGFTPRTVQECARTTSAVHFVAAGLGVTLIPGWLCAMPVPGVIYRKVAAPAPSARIMLMHRSGRLSVPATNLVAIARQLRSTPSI